MFKGVEATGVQAQVVVYAPIDQAFRVMVGRYTSNDWSTCSRAESMSRKLRITLYVVAAYLGAFGTLFVFAPSLFERSTQSTLPDAKLTLLYGQYTLTFAYVAFMAAREKDATSTLS